MGLLDIMGNRSNPLVYRDEQDGALWIGGQRISEETERTVKTAAVGLLAMTLLAPKKDPQGPGGTGGWL